MYHDTTSFGQLTAPVRPAQVTRRVTARRGGHTRIGIARVWREALAAFAAQPAPILLCAAVGLAAPGVLAVALDAPPLEVFIHGQAALCAFRVLSGGPAWLWGGLGLLAQVLAQGMIAALALRETPHAPVPESLVTSLRAAGRTVLSRSPALLWGWLQYVGLVVIAIAGLSVPLLKLHLDPVQLRADVDIERPLDHPVDLLVAVLGREVEAHVVNSLLPDPGPLACGVAEAVQATLFRHAPDPAGPTWQLVSTYRPPLVQPDAAWVWPVTLGSLALLLLVETLLRFRSVAALTDHPRAGISVAGRHFGVVTLHGWLLHLATACVQVLFIVVPTLLAERLVIPRVGRMIEAPWVVPACVLLVAAGVAAVNSVLSAFAAVYDARLLVALQRADP